MVKKNLPRKKMMVKKKLPERWVQCILIPPLKCFKLVFFPQFYIVRVNTPSIKKIPISVKITKKVTLFSGRNCKSKYSVLCSTYPTISPKTRTNALSYPPHSIIQLLSQGHESNGTPREVFVSQKSLFFFSCFPNFCIFGGSVIQNFDTNRPRQYQRPTCRGTMSSYKHSNIPITINAAKSCLVMTQKDPSNLLNLIPF